MPDSRVTGSPRRPLLGRRNLLLLGGGLLTLAVAYGVLAAGHATLAAALLVVGYCIIFPLGIAL